MFLLSGIMVVIGFTLGHRLQRPPADDVLPHRRRLEYRAGGHRGGLDSDAGGRRRGHRQQGRRHGPVVYLVAGVWRAGRRASFAAARFPRFAPALKMGVAYPLANRFRTGMTIAMFSLIIFSLTVFSIINANSSSKLSGKTGDGGWNVVATANRNNPVDHLPDAVKRSRRRRRRPDRAVGRVTVYSGEQKVQQVGTTTSDSRYPVLAADDGVLLEPTTSRSPLAPTATPATRDVFAAVRTESRYALVDGADFSETTAMADRRRQRQPVRAVRGEVRDPARA